MTKEQIKKTIAILSKVLATDEEAMELARLAKIYKKRGRQLSGISYMSLVLSK